jgi:uncharacterized protein YggE
MNNRNSIVILVIVFLALFLLPIKNIEWGKVRWLQAETVTVVGEAKTTQQNQIASFTAGVNIIKDKKEDAVSESNQKMNALIEVVKGFGISEADIKTQNMSVYQQQDLIKTKTVSQWVANNSVEITVRDITKVNQLTDLLNSSGANNVYGPNFRIDETNSVEKTLYDSAIQDAKDKATLIAKASNRKLGKVIMVNDGGSTNNIYPMYNMALKTDAMGGGAVSQPGSATVSKNLTVSFELN